MCGLRGREAGEQDLNVFNFERFKWGGVRRHSVPYIAFDLKQFASAPRPRPSDADIALGRQLTSYLSGLPAAATASQAAAGMTFIKGNKAEREVILDILGVTGILQTAAHPGFASAYVPAAQRHLPPRRFTDRAYPVLVAGHRRRQHHCAAPVLPPDLALPPQPRPARHAGADQPVRRGLTTIANYDAWHPERRFPSASGDALVTRRSGFLRTGTEPTN